MSAKKIAFLHLLSGCLKPTVDVDITLQPARSRASAPPPKNSAHCGSTDYPACLVLVNRTCCTNARCRSLCGKRRFWEISCSMPAISSSTARPCSNQPIARSHQYGVGHRSPATATSRAESMFEAKAVKGCSSGLTIEGDFISDLVQLGRGRRVQGESDRLSSV